jgi:hypothetical protein
MNLRLGLEFAPLWQVVDNVKPTRITHMTHPTGWCDTSATPLNRQKMQKVADHLDLKAFRVWSQKVRYLSQMTNCRLKQLCEVPVDGRTRKEDPLQKLTDRQQQTLIKGH